mmetsp:Transcript_556/g.1055  ORF Transcript_556/g.1055 Transcript_556/m.1055 type:complete len:464 (+) Transcript_556:84-1475(+)
MNVKIMLEILSQHSFLIGLIIRLVIAWLLPMLLDDGKWIPGVAYTDIDFHVFSDAAAYCSQGESPYKRTTYRYTPFLAQLLAMFGSYKEGGRYLFCLADAFCGWMIAKYRQRQRRQTNAEKHKQQNNQVVDALWWLFNPLAINICTRGSAESFMVLLPVLVTVWIVTWARSAKHFQRIALAALAGMCHGISIHLKLVPIIYMGSFCIALAGVDSNPVLAATSSAGTTFSTIKAWAVALLQPAPIAFGIASVATFLGSTALAVHFYGITALEEGLLYHFSRVDHRHNYSSHWYWIYLARAAIEGPTGQIDSSQQQQDVFLLQLLPWVGRLLLVPQLAFLASSSFVLAAQDLTLALFVQTFAFVAFNKVITAQYFTWYLCLLPLCSHRFSLTKSNMQAMAGLIVSILLWLGLAYLLEMQGLQVFALVWVASMIFFLAEVNLLVSFLRSASRDGNETIDHYDKKTR